MIDQKDVFNEVLAELAVADPRVLALTADMGSRILPDFMRLYPDRTLNFGVAEQSMLAQAAGLARGGFMPFATTIAAFISMRAFEQVRTDIGYPGLNVKIVGTGSGLAYGTLGPTHFALEDVALLRTIPNLTILCPADGPETAWALRAAYDIEGPVYIRLDRGKVPSVYADADSALGEHRVGRADWVSDDGGRERVDVCLIATGVMAHEALLADARLADEGIMASVVNMHTLKPLDEEAVVRASRRSRGLVTVEDHTVIGGLGSAVATCLATHPRAEHRPLRILGVPDLFPHLTDDADGLRAAYGLNAEGIARAARELLLLAHLTD